MRYMGKDFKPDPKLCDMCSDNMYEYCKAPDRKVRATEDELRQWKAERTKGVAVGVRELGPWEGIGAL